MTALTDLSTFDRTAKRDRTSKLLGPARSLAERDAAAVLRVCRTAADMAAAERSRHGDRPDPETVADAAAETAASLYRDQAENGDGLPTLEGVTDPDRPTLPIRDGEVLTARPHPELVARAGAWLDAERRRRDVALADLGGLAAISASSRRSAAAKRRDPMTSALADPADLYCPPRSWAWEAPTAPSPADPESPELAAALTAAGVWPGPEPIRLAALDQVSTAPPVADDLAAIPYGAGKTAANLSKARQRGREALGLDADGRPDPDRAPTSTALDLAEHLREATAPDPLDQVLAERAALTSVLTSAGFDPAERTAPAAIPAEWLRLRTSITSAPAAPAPALSTDGRDPAPVRPGRVVPDRLTVAGTWRPDLDADRPRRKAPALSADLGPRADQDPARAHAARLAVSLAPVTGLRRKVTRPAPAPATVTRPPAPVGRALRTADLLAWISAGLDR